MADLNHQGIFTAKLGATSLWVPEFKNQRFTITKEENDIPRFSFILENCDVNRTAIAADIDEDFVIYHDATPVFIGSIDCDQIEYLSIDRISVRGYAKWIELGYSIFKRMADADAESADAVFIRDDPSTWTDRTTEAGNDTINDVSVTFNSASDGIYIGDNDIFHSIKVKYSTKGVQNGTPTFNVQYSKGSSVWATLDCVDESRHFTEDAGTYFVFMPTLPSDWAKNTVNSSSKYWIRITLATGAYSVNPKLDRIWISQTDVCRVQIEDTTAKTTLGYLLDGTGYSEDATDQCPSTVIAAIRGEYESRLHWIAGLINALEWDDGNGDAQPYAWWIDDSKKVHVKQIRGTTHGDITEKVGVLGNRLNHFKTANRVFGLGGGGSINQYRAVVEDQGAQDTLGEIRETTYRDSRIFDYALLKGQSRKLLAQSKTAQAQVQCTMPIYDWYEGGYEIGDIIKLRQYKWGIPDETEYAIRRVDISLSGVKFDVGIGREHLDNLQGNIQQQINIHDVYMQGVTSTFQVGPVNMNYQRVDDTTVYPVKMIIEVPSDTQAINKALISWELGPYRATVTGTGPGGGHAHDPASPNTGTGGGHAHGDFVGLGGGHTPTELGKAHTHDIDQHITMYTNSVNCYVITASITGYEFNHTHTGGITGSESAHTHSGGATGAGSDHYHANPNTGAANPATHTHTNPATGTASTGHTHSIPATDTIPAGDIYDAIYDFNAGSDCVAGSCIQYFWTWPTPVALHVHPNTGVMTGSSGSAHTHSQGVTGADGAHTHVQGNTGLEGMHTHPFGATGAGTSHTHSTGTTGAGGGHHHTLPISEQAVYVTPITAELTIALTESDDPAHIHTIDTVDDHNDHGIETLPDFSLSVPGTDTEPDFSLDLNYGIHEEAGGTIMDLIVNGVTVGSYDGDKTDVKIRGFLQNGRNDVVLQPQSGQNHKGSAQLDATIKVFMDTE